jgi:starch synthase
VPIRLKIAIATAGRFHVLDLARELHELGHDVKFYSYVPRARARRFGLPPQCHVSLLPLVFPLVVWERFARRLAPRLRERLLYVALNWAVMLRLKPCDLFHCMSGIYLEAPRYAKTKYGAKIWLVRGSRHILSQDEILSRTTGAERPSQLTIERELAGYALADRICIASGHVEESFRFDKAAHEKLFQRSYGTDLTMFSLRPKAPQDGTFTILFVGTWSLQKGCDLLVAAVNGLGDVRLHHVGAIGDTPFPKGDDRFQHTAPVSQQNLPQYYEKADLFVLPSRQDGFGMVLVQALASGLPVICSDHTGGADLAHTPSLAERITIVPHGDVSALQRAIAVWRDRLRAGNDPPPLTQQDRETLTWRSYADCYCEQLEADFAKS